ncbi:MAG: hypothetical protein ACK41F_13930 [Fimbriimonadaceae bacterium]
MLILLLSTIAFAAEAADPVAVWLRVSTWTGTQPPNVVVYADRTLVRWESMPLTEVAKSDTISLSRGRKLAKQIAYDSHYVVSTLSDAEWAELNLRIDAAFRSFQPKRAYNIGQYSDPDVELLFASDGDVSWTVGIVAAFDDEYQDPRVLPLPVRDYFECLRGLRGEGARVWEPSEVDVVFYPHSDEGLARRDWLISRKRKHVTWPSELPSVLASVESKPLRQRFPGSYYLRIRELTLGGPVEIGGRLFTVASRPVFPSEGAWEEAFRLQR